MKQRIWALMAVLVVFTYVLVACGGGKQTKPPKTTKPLVRYTVGMFVSVGRATTTPSWTDLEGGITSFGGVKFTWIKGVGLSKSQSIARKSAKADARGNLAEAISVIVARQFAQAWEALGVGDDEQIEQVKQGLTATKSRVTVRGFRTLRSHKEQVAPIVSLRPDGQPDRLGKAKWRYHVMMGLPYARYKRMRDNVVRKVIRRAPNNRQKELIRKANKQLKKLDGDPKELEVPASKKAGGPAV